MSLDLTVTVFALEPANALASTLTTVYVHPLSFTLAGTVAFAEEDAHDTYDAVRFLCETTRYVASVAPLPALADLPSARPVGTSVQLPVMLVADDLDMRQLPAPPGTAGTLPSSKSALSSPGKTESTGVPCFMTAGPPTAFPLASSNAMTL